MFTDGCFESGKPLPHILMRDYARGVIEVALHRGARLDIDIAKVRPPYRSDWPSIDVPELDELKAWGKEKAGMPDKEMARVYLYGAVMGEGILEESYVLDSFNEWSSQRIGKAHKPTHKELHDPIRQESDQAPKGSMGYILYSFTEYQLLSYHRTRSTREIF